MESAEIIQSGNSQIIRLPEAYRFLGEKVYLKRVGNALLIIPEYDSWASLIDSVHLFSEDFMTERGQPEQQRENFSE